MNVSTYYGFICPKCRTTIGIGIGEPNCPHCGTNMVANKKSAPFAANVHCKKCNASFGIINSISCPLCGTDFE